MAQLKDLIVNGASRFIGDIFGTNATFSGDVMPETDNTQSLGDSTHRWKLYGTITGSLDNDWKIKINNTQRTYNGSADVDAGSIYAPTAGGTANTQALVGNGATTAPKWVNISPSITITAGTSSATPKVNVTVLGQSGTAQAITTATIGVYGATKLTDAYTSSDATLAATGKSILAAIQTLDVSAQAGAANKTLTSIAETDGKITGVTYSDIAIAASQITSGILGTARGGTGNSSFTANRLIYSESATKLSSSGHYTSSSKVAINSTSEPSYNLYVNGTSYFNGNTTHAGTISVTGSGTFNDSLVINANKNYPFYTNDNTFFVNKAVNWNQSSYQEWVYLLIPVLTATNQSAMNYIDGTFHFWKTGGNVYDNVYVNLNCCYNVLEYYLESYGQGTDWKLVRCTYNGIQYYALKGYYHANPYTHVTFTGHIRSDLAGGNNTSTKSLNLPYAVAYYNYTSNSANAVVLNSEIQNSLTDTLTNTYVTSVSRRGLSNPGGFIGNATTAATLQTARTINGTSFNGSANITTANWGTARNIYIADSDGTNTGAAVSVNGSANATLKLPATIKASLSGNATTASKLSNTAKIGDTNKPVYFTANGVPAAINYTIDKSVPSNAVFTDRYVNSASFAHDATNNNIKMTLTRAGSDTATIIGNIPAASASSSGVISTNTQTFAGAKTFNNIITANASGNSITGIKTYTGVANAGKTYINWVKFASLQLNDSNHFGNQQFDIHLSRTYNSPSSEVYSIRVNIGWNTCHIIQLGGSAGSQIIRKFRVVKDNTNHVVFFEYEVNPSYSSYQNAVNIKVIGYHSGNDLTLLNEVDNNVDSFYANCWSIDLASNQIVSNISGNATTATRANITTTTNALAYYTNTTGTFGDSAITITKASKHIAGFINGGQKSGTTLGAYATAEGRDTTASGDYSHAEGTNTTASGYCSHAEGAGTTASGSYPHAEGGGTTASGNYSHAEGLNTTASGDYSHAEGLLTVANARSQHAFGEYNINDPSYYSPGHRGAYIEIVGNGESNTNRSNARTLDWSGNECLAGNLVPMSTNTQNIGTSTVKWATIYATTFDGTATKANKLKTTQATNATKMFILGQSAAGAGQDTYIATAYSSGSANTTGIYFQGSTGVLMGAAWNDYAEFRQLKENKMYATTVEPGRVVYENGDDTLSISSKRLMRGCSIVSDTYGFGIGESEKAQLPIAVSGRVLAYPYENREEFKNHIGWPVCSGPNGTVSIMTEEEEMKYPSRIIGIISAVPNYEVWHGGADVIVNGRVWIKVK